MTRIKLIVAGAKARAEVDGILTSCAVGIPVSIEYDSTWDGLTKNLVCTSGRWGPDGKTGAIVNIQNSAIVANEVMIADNHLYLGVEGYNADGTLVIPTNWADCGVIRAGVSVNASPSANPSLPIWAQLQQQINSGEGGYYLPKVTQPEDGTIQFDFTPSRTGMPAVKPVVVMLSASDSSQSGDGLTATDKSLILPLFKNAAYTADMSAPITQLETLWSGSGGDNSGGSGDTEYGVSQVGSVLTISGVADITTITQSGTVLTMT